MEDDFADGRLAASAQAHQKNGGVGSFFRGGFHNEAGLMFLSVRK